jgi:hypothetical protein
MRGYVSVEDAVAACRVYEANVASVTGFAPFAASNLKQHLFDVGQNFADDVRPIAWDSGKPRTLNAF